MASFDHKTNFIIYINISTLIILLKYDWNVTLKLSYLLSNHL